MKNRKLKIALVSQEYPPETARGGIGTQTLAKAIGLAALGHEIFVISRSIDDKRYEKTDGNLTVIRIPGMEDAIPDMTEPVQWLSHSLVVAAELEVLQSRVQLDLIDFPEWAAEGYAYLLNRTAWNYVPVVIHLHGSLVMFSDVMDWPEKKSAFYKAGFHMEATCTQLADAIYSSSECSAEWVRKYYGVKSKDIPIIHLGVDTAVFKPPTSEKAVHPTILLVGRLAPNKGIQELVRAAIALRDEFPNLKLRIIGKGDEKLIAKLKALAINAGAHELLDFAGYVHKEELPNELSGAHVFAMPSYYEGGPGFAFLEAMACGVPVVGCSGSGVDEIVTSGVNGLLVPPKTISALESALRKMLKDKNLLAMMGANARQFVLEHANSKKCVERLETLYQSIVQKHQRTQFEETRTIRSI
jgi:glycosyltransferase involved in cell wall biosynthesis